MNILNALVGVALAAINRSPRAMWSIEAKAVPTVLSCSAWLYL
jgi:hypothetical protein